MLFCFQWNPWPLLWSLLCQVAPSVRVQPSSILWWHRFLPRCWKPSPCCDSISVWWNMLSFSGWILVKHAELFRMNPGGTCWTFQDASWWNTLNFAGWIHDVEEHQCSVWSVILKWCHHFVVMMSSVYDVILWYVISFWCYYALMKFLFPSGAVMTSLLFGERLDSAFLPG